jgi:hypothetical protein
VEGRGMVKYLWTSHPKALGCARRCALQQEGSRSNYCQT